MPKGFIYSHKILWKNLSEVKRLIEIHTQITGGKPGFKHKVEVLNKSAIVLDTGNPDSGSASLDVVFDGTNFVIAQNTNKGILKVSVIPENSTRSQF